MQSNHITVLFSICVCVCRDSIVRWKCKMKACIIDWISILLIEHIHYYYYYYSRLGVHDRHTIFAYHRHHGIVLSAVRDVGYHQWHAESMKRCCHQCGSNLLLSNATFGTCIACDSLHNPHRSHCSHWLLQRHPSINNKVATIRFID